MPLTRLLKSYPEVAGYYVFDEPAFDHTEDGGVPRVHAEFQQRVYDAIREEDLNLLLRPVFNSNILYDKTTSDGVMSHETLDNYISPSFQDLILLQRYYATEEKTTKETERWDYTGVLRTIAHMVLLPTFVPESAMQECNDIDPEFDIFDFDSMYHRTVGGFPNIAAPLGYGYFVYRPRGLTEYWNNLEMALCPLLSQEAQRHIAARNYGIITRISSHDVNNLLTVETTLADSHFKNPRSFEVVQVNRRDYQVLSSSSVGNFYLSLSSQDSLEVGDRLYRTIRTSTDICIVTMSAYHEGHFYIKTNLAESELRVVSTGELFRVGGMLVDTASSTTVGNLYLDASLEDTIQLNSEVERMYQTLPSDQSVIIDKFMYEGYLTVRTTKSATTYRNLQPGDVVTIEGTNYNVQTSTTVGNIYLDPAVRNEIYVGYLVHY